MNRTEFLEIINNPDLLSDVTLPQLQEIVNEYPFFQAARMLLVKNLHKLDHIRYNSELKHSAVYIADRAKLFFLINDIGKKKPVVEINVSDFVEDNAADIVDSTKEEEIGNIDSVFQDNKSEAVEESTSEFEGIQNDVVSARLNVTATDNYLQAEDEYVNDNGGFYNFSFKKTVPTEPIDEELDDIVFPSADLLDYESSASGAYVLPDLDEVESVSFDENRSFSDWLHVMRYSAPEKQQDNNKSKKGMDLINNFLTTQPKIVPAISKKHINIDLSEERETSEEDILSETLANIYIKQGHKIKAIAIFEKLRLKYPEKNVYFANRISGLKEN